MASQLRAGGQAEGIAIDSIIVVHLEWRVIELAFCLLRIGRAEQQPGRTNWTRPAALRAGFALNAAEIYPHVFAATGGRHHPSTAQEEVTAPIAFRLAATSLRRNQQKGLTSGHRGKPGVGRAAYQG